MAKVLRRWLDPATEVTVHGFRATARTWAAEQTDHSSDIAEIALARTSRRRDAGRL